MSSHDDTPPLTPTGAWGLEPLMPVSTVYDWRVRGRGPVAYRFGKHLKFAVSDVRAWIAEQREPTNQPGRTDWR